MKILINEHKPQGGTKTLYSVTNEKGEMLIDTTGSLSMVYYGYSEKEAREFFDSIEKPVWY